MLVDQDELRVHNCDVMHVKHYNELYSTYNILCTFIYQCVGLHLK